MSHKNKYTIIIMVLHMVIMQKISDDEIFKAVERGKKKQETWYRNLAWINYYGVHSAWDKESTTDNLINDMKTIDENDD